MKDRPLNDPGAFWDEKFDGPDYRYGKKPNAFVAEVLPELVEPEAKVLCVGDGEGRNGVWCARQGYETTSLEPSAVGTSKIKALAAEQGVELEVIQDRMPSDEIDEAAFDVVVLTYVHAPEPMRRQIHSACLRALRSGGVVVLEGFTPDQRRNDRTSGGPPKEELMFTAEILRDDFRGAHLELLSEMTVELAEGDGHRGPADVVRMIARKPAQ